MTIKIFRMVWAMKFADQYINCILIEKSIDFRQKSEKKQKKESFKYENISS